MLVFFVGMPNRSNYIIINLITKEYVGGGIVGRGELISQNGTNWVFSYEYSAPIEDKQPKLLSRKELNPILTNTPSKNPTTAVLIHRKKYIRVAFQVPTLNLAHDAYL